MKTSSLEGVSTLHDDAASPQDDGTSRSLMDAEHAGATTIRSSLNGNIVIASNYIHNVHCHSCTTAHCVSKLLSNLHVGRYNSNAGFDNEFWCDSRE
mmetsp:Transcript_12065/g.28332  ORF Transcript_12065/g.28332 Transcript_12065/m.28332 type:complete len:97 (-) Transcript_12065:557-847(-)